MPVIDLPPEPTVVLTVAELAQALVSLTLAGHGALPLVIETSNGDRNLALEVNLEPDTAVRLYLGEKVA